jgi:hypothetical protein
LPGYTIGGLVGHVGAAVAWLEPLLEAAPPKDAPVISFGEYYKPLVMRQPDDFDAPLHVGAREQGERGAARGPAETVARMRARLDRIRARLADEVTDRLLDLRPTLPIAIQLEDFLRTRVVELVVHGDDLAVSVGLAPEPPSASAAVTIDTLLATARAENGDLEVIRALARGGRSTAHLMPVL